MKKEVFKACAEPNVQKPKKKSRKQFMKECLIALNEMYLKMIEEWYLDDAKELIDMMKNLIDNIRWED